MRVVSALKRWWLNMAIWSCNVLPLTGSWTDRWTDRRTEGKGEGNGGNLKKKRKKRKHGENHAWKVLGLPQHVHQIHVITE